MPNPPLATRQFFRSFGFAFFRRGYQARGTDITRPSLRETVSASGVTLTLATRPSAARAEEPIPCLQKQFLILFHEQFYPSQNSRTKSIIAYLRGGKEPKLH